MDYPSGKDDRARVRQDIVDKAVEEARTTAVRMHMSLNCVHARVREAAYGTTEVKPHCKNTGVSCLCECHDA